MKALELDACFDSKSEPNKGNDKGKYIIDLEPNTTVATTKIKKIELADPEEGECLFHSQMWVKGLLLQFIVDSRSQKKLISISHDHHTTLATVHHRGASPRTRSPHQPTVLPSLQHEALRG